MAWIAFSSPPQARWTGVIFMVGVFACVVLHELGHSLTAQRYGIGVAEIVLYPIGGIARMEKLPKPAQELWIALAGPAVNVVIAGILFGVLSASGGLKPASDLSLLRGDLLSRLLYTNLWLAAFNMIPAFPMDGGRVLRALLGLRMGEVRATEIAAGIGQILAIVAGFVALMGPNIFLLFIAFFVFIGAGQEASMYRGKALVEGLPVRAAMITEFQTLPVGSSLKQAAEVLLSTTQQDFPIMNGDEVVGVLPRNVLLRGLAESGPDAYVAEAMIRDFPVVAPDGDLEDIASDMQSGQSPVVLVKEDGRLVGLITLENLAELLIVRQITQRNTAAAGR
jgi:Zn-dependent protease